MLHACAERDSRGGRGQRGPAPRACPLATACRSCCPQAERGPLLRLGPPGSQCPAGLPLLPPAPASPSWGQVLGQGSTGHLRPFLVLRRRCPSISGPPCPLVQGSSGRGVREGTLAGLPTPAGEWAIVLVGLTATGRSRHQAEPRLLDFSRATREAVLEEGAPHRHVDSGLGGSRRRRRRPEAPWA